MRSNNTHAHDAFMRSIEHVPAVPLTEAERARLRAFQDKLDAIRKAQEVEDAARRKRFLDGITPDPRDVDAGIERYRIARAENYDPEHEHMPFPLRLKG